MRLFSLVVPFCCCCGSHRFPSNDKPDDRSLKEWQRMVLSETLGLMAFFDCPRGHWVASETRVLGTSLTFTGCEFPLKSNVSKSPTVTAGNWFPKMDSLSARGAQAVCGFK